MPFKRRVEPWPEDDGHEFIHPDHFRDARNTVRLMPDNRWRAFSTLGHNLLEECPWCGTLTPDWSAKRMHITFHDYLEAMHGKVVQLEDRIAKLESLERRVERIERWVNMPIDAELPKELEEEDVSSPGSQ